MSSKIDLSGKVAIVTGGGGALGRAYSLILASRGCKVVVNDLGTSMKGDSLVKSQSAAQRVVDEIVSKGGQAVADYNNVLEGEEIVKTAINNFGRLDIVINNAGNLRDVSFIKMTDEDWKLVFDVHVNGAYKVTKAAWPHLLKNGGRVIMTSSAAGLYGNFGQANYSAAKMALVGFAKSLAKEGQRKGVFVNVIAPVAGSRMTETVMPKELTEALKPEYIAPLVLYLVSEVCQENGQIFEVGGGWISAVRLQRSSGVSLSECTPESVRDKIQQVVDFSEPSYPETLQDSFQIVMEAAKKVKLPSSPSTSQKPPSSTSSSAVSEAKASSNFESTATFEMMQKGIQAYPDAVKSVKAVFNYQVTNKNKEKQEWTLDLKSSPPKVYPSAPQNVKADTTIIINDEDFVALANKKTNAQTLFMSGKLKIKGNLQAAMKFDKVLAVVRQQAKL